MDPDRKSLIFKITGLIVGVFAIFTLVASVSYLMTWQEDQSLMSSPDMLDKGVEVSNAAGKIGYRWGAFPCVPFPRIGQFCSYLPSCSLSFQTLFLE